MTATRDDAPATPKRRAPAKKAAKTGVAKGAAPAKKAAKRAPTGRKRAATGAAESTGARLRRELTQERDSVGVTMLIRQAARVADRLENIDRVLSGDARAWVRVGIPRLDTDGGRVVVEVTVDGLVKEERAQTTVLRNLLSEIHRQRSGLPGAPPGDEDDDLDV